MAKVSKADLQAQIEKRRRGPVLDLRMPRYEYRIEPGPSVSVSLARRAKGTPPVIDLKNLSI
jgi:hypothetical protein